MKTTKHFFRTLLPIAALALLCAPPINAQYITLNLSQPSNPKSIAYFTDEDGKEYDFWKDTYNRADELKWLEFQDFFQLSHMLWGDPAMGSQMTYWDGFTICKGGDNTNYSGGAGAGGSANWVSHQWGCMAGGGIRSKVNGDPYINSKTGKPQVTKDSPYIVAYWGYSHSGNYADSEWKKPTQQEKWCLHIKWKDGRLHRPQGIYINNHPWPYYGNIIGDGFARPFAEGDHFYLVIRGLNSQGQDIGIAITHVLAEYKNGKLTQSPDWEYVDLSSLGAVSGIYFTMETTDEDANVGPNTAAYFCLDKLSVTREVEYYEQRVVNLKATEIHEQSVTLTWDELKNASSYTIYQDGVFIATTTDNSYTINDLAACTNYNFSIEPQITKSSRSGIYVTTIDETAPNRPDSIFLNGENAVGTDYIKVKWQHAIDNIGIEKYNIYLDNELYDVNKGYFNFYTFDDLEENTEYLIEIEAEDAAGNKSDKTGLRVKTLSNTITSVEPILQSADPIQVYNIFGMYMGNHIPTGHGIYIIKNGTKTYKVKIQ